MTEIISLAVIGGSGLYNMPQLEDIIELDIQTPFGKPSSPIIVGTLSSSRVAFMVRHGRGHFLSPSEVNYRANIYALKSLGIKQIVSVSACGSLREDYAPGEIVIPDQLVDFTKDRKRSFFGDGIVGHVGVANPFCPDLSSQVFQAVKKTGATVHSGGTSITVEGPRFSTIGESHLFRKWGMSIIGMTTSPEAFLAREAELCYTVLAHVTDYDVWRQDEAPVSVEMVMNSLRTDVIQEALFFLINSLDSERNRCECPHSLDSAIITNPELISEEAKRNLSLLVKRVLAG